MRGTLELLGRRPDLFGRDFDAGDGVDDHERGVGDAQRRARIAQEIRHPRRVDEVDLVLVPLDVGEAAGERVLPGDFLFVVIRDRRPVVHTAESVDRAGVEEQRGDQLRLAGAAMTDEGDISDVGSIVDLHVGNPPVSVSCSSWPAVSFSAYASFPLRAAPLAAQEANHTQVHCVEPKE